MTILRDGYPLWGTLQPGSCAPLAYAERLLENIMAHFKPAFQASSLHWVLSGTKWKRLGRIKQDNELRLQVAHQSALPFHIGLEVTWEERT